MENPGKGNVSLIVKNWLRKNGYEIRTHKGQIDGWNDELEILVKDDKPRKFLWFKLEPKYIVTGIIWFRNCEGCNHNAWVIEVKGMKHLASTRKLANDMRNELKVTLTVRLISPE